MKVMNCRTTKFGIRLFCVPAMLICTFTVGAQNQAPTAVISVVGKTPVNGKIAVKAGESVQFVGTGSSDPEKNPLKYLWNFGDGQTSTSAVPRHTYANNGTYNVSLTVDDGYEATSTGVNPNFPAEPAGLNLVSNNDFSWIGPAGLIDAPDPTHPGWFSSNGGGFLSTVDDPTAPLSAPKVLQYRFPAGHEGGKGVGSYDRGIWQGGARAQSMNLREIFIGFYFWFGPNWWNADGTKIWYLHQEDASGNRNAQYFCFNTNIYSGELQKNPQMKIKNASELTQQNTFANRSPGLMTPGHWYRIEFYAKQQGGIMKWWVTDASQKGSSVLVADYQNIPWFPDPFSTLQLHHVWESTPNLKVPADQFTRFDHIYISGR